MSGLPIPPVTPVTAFDELLDALATVSETLDDAGQAETALEQDSALDVCSVQLVRVLAAHKWLVEHGDALADLRDVLTFIYGEVEG